MTALIQFAASAFGAAITVRASTGERLLDICDQHDAPVPFSCRSATCGTCLVAITRGAELLDRIGPDERLILDTLGCPAPEPASPAAAQAPNQTSETQSGAAIATAARHHRLACQANITRSGVIAVELASPPRG